MLLSFTKWTWLYVDDDDYFYIYFDSGNDELLSIFLRLRLFVFLTKWIKFFSCIKQEYHKVLVSCDNFTRIKNKYVDMFFTILITKSEEMNLRWFHFNYEYSKYLLYQTYWIVSLTRTTVNFFLLCQLNELLNNFFGPWIFFISTDLC